MEIRTWHDDYTDEELENIITNMLNRLSDIVDENYNYGNDFENKKSLIEYFTDIGFHIDEVNGWYNWLD